MSFLLIIEGLNDKGRSHYFFGGIFLREKGVEATSLERSAQTKLIRLGQILRILIEKDQTLSE